MVLYVCHWAECLQTLTAQALQLSYTLFPFLGLKAGLSNYGTISDSEFVLSFQQLFMKMTG